MGKKMHFSLCLQEGKPLRILKSEVFEEERQMHLEI